MVALQMTEALWDSSICLKIRFVRPILRMSHGSKWLKISRKCQRKERLAKTEIRRTSYQMSNGKFKAPDKPLSADLSVVSIGADEVSSSVAAQCNAYLDI